MTQNSKTEIPSTTVTGDLLRELDTNTIVVVTPSGQRIGQSPSITFGLGSWDGDYDGFAEWLASQV